MRHILFFLLISVLSIESTTAQIKELQSTIDRDNPNSYYIVDTEADSTLITKFGKDKNINTSDFAFTSLKGEGRLKDELGTREKNKTYLRNKIGDTLITVRKKSDKVEFADGTFVRMIETNEGWDFVDSDNNLVYELELLWNPAKWKYKIKIYDNHQNIEHLNKYATLALSDWARYKSNKDINDAEGDSTFWFVMYLAAL